MRFIILLLGISCSCHLVARTASTETNTESHYLTQRPAHASTVQYSYAKIDGSTEAQAWLTNRLQSIALPQSHLELTNHKTSAYADHYLFQQYYGTHKVYLGQVKINVAKGGEILSVFDRTITDVYLANASFPTAHEWIVYNGKTARSGNMSHQLTNDALWETIKFDEEVLIQINLASYAKPVAEIDTVLTGYIFQPDPLTSAGVTYGGSYSDNNDADNAFLSAERIQASTTGTYNTTTGVFTLDNDYVVIEENQNPSVTPVTSLTTAFDFERSESGFEDYNAFYHLNTYINYLINLGFEDLVNFKISVDTHAHSGNDNSSFAPGINPVLRFGEGGVDDAEDADVVVHEYAHALSASAAPNTNSGAERQALDEGLGDYVAASYSYALNAFSWGEIFTWDGHNEYWEGRLANTTKVYPEGLQGDKHKDGEMWASALMEINQSIGREETDNILFNSIYNWSTGMSLSDAADIFLQSDSFINGAMYQQTICDIFLNRGLVDVCEVGVTTNILTSAISIEGIDAFSSNNGPLIVSSSSGSKICAEIFDIQGRLLTAVHSNDSVLALAGESLAQGNYILVIKTDVEIATRKLYKQ